MIYLINDFSNARVEFIKGKTIMQSKILNQGSLFLNNLNNTKDNFYLPH